MFRYENEFCALRVGGRNALTADAPTAAILFFGAEKPESRSGERRKAPLAPAVARQSEAGGRLDEDV